MSKKKVSIKKNEVKTKQVSLPKKPNWTTNSSLHYLLIGLCAFLLYANTLTHDYCQDDAIVITDNMFTQKGIEGIAGIWNKDTFYGFFKKEGKDKLVAGGRYRPLTLVLFALEWELYSEKDNKGVMKASPFGFHLVNVLLFVLLGLLLYKVTITLLAYYDVQQAKLIAFFSSLLFVAHPIHTEVVANIKGADEIVALIGSLGTLYFMLKAYRTGKIWMLLVGMFIFGITLFSKENTITFLAIIPVTMFLFGRKGVGLSKEKVRRFLIYNVALILSAIPFLMKRSQVLFGKPFQLMGPKQPDLELMNNPFLKYVDHFLVPFSFSERLATIVYTLGGYLRLLFAPFKLTHDYYPNHIKMMHFGDWQVILSIALYLGMCYLAAKNWRKKPMITFGIIIYLASLSIVSNLLFPVGVFMAERFLFMPSVGFAWVLGAIAFSFYRKGKQRLVYGVLGLLMVVFSFLTVTRNNAWENNSTLFLTDVKTSLRSAKVRNSAGGTMLSMVANEQDELKRNQKANQALVHLKIALEEHPRYANAWLLQGNAYNVLERFDEAIESYQNALKLKPNYPEAINNLGITYRHAGKYFGEKKRDTKKAIPYLLKAVKINPEEVEANRLMGIAYAINGQPDLGLPYLEKAFALAPNAQLALDLNLIFRQIGDEEKAGSYYKKAIELDPEAVTKRTQSQPSK